MNWSNEWKDALEIAPKVLSGELKDIQLQLIINYGDFPTQVGAVKIGDLAVHKNLRKDCWQVTHIPTLTRFNAIMGLHKQSDLIEWCKKVQASNQEDWKELAFLNKDNYADRSEAKDRIMYLCQNTPIGSDGEWR